MTPVNSYPLLPVLPYQRTTVAMNLVISAIKAMFISKEVKIAMYVMFRNESGNGKCGINNNYTGVQADGGQWPADLATYIVGTTVLPENETGKVRRFAAFQTVEGNLAFLADRVQKRGLFVGGKSTKITTMQIDSAAEWCEAYYKSWVTGNAAAVLPQAEQKSLLSMYEQGEDIFRNH